MAFVHLVAAVDSQTASRASSAFAMLVAITLLLGLFLLGVVLIMVARRIRQRRAQRVKVERASRLDPWQESAKRLQPYPRQDQSDAAEQ
jgi:O-antigen ligase